MNATLGFLVLGGVSLVSAGPSDYGGDVEFLRKHTEVVELRQGDAAVAIAPAYQGRVMTSTVSGDSGTSFGWLNYKLIKARLHTTTGEISRVFNGSGR